MESVDATQPPTATPTPALAARNEAMRQALRGDAARTLRAVLGDDVDQLEHIAVDQDGSRFYDVVAPEPIIERLRAAGLLLPDAGTGEHPVEANGPGDA